MRYIYIITLIAVLSTSCAYNFSGVKRKLPGGHDRIFVPIFKNSSIEPGIEVYFTNAFIREFNRSRAAKITDKADAQVKIEGIIDVLNYESAAPDRSARELDADGNETINRNLPIESLSRNLPYGSVLTTEYRIRIETFFVIRRIADNKVIWKGRFKGEKSYAAPQVGSAIVNTVNPLYNHSARHQNIALIAEDMMSEAHDRITVYF